MIHRRQHTVQSVDAYALTHTKKEMNKNKTVNRQIDINLLENHHYRTAMFIMKMIRNIN